MVEDGKMMVVVGEESASKAQWVISFILSIRELNNKFQHRKQMILHTTTTTSTRSD